MAPNGERWFKEHAQPSWERRIQFHPRWPQEMAQICQDPRCTLAIIVSLFLAHRIVLFSSSFRQGDPAGLRSPTLVGRLCMLPSKPESSVDSWCYGHMATGPGSEPLSMAPFGKPWRQAVQQWKGDSVSCGKINKNINRFQMVSCRPMGQFNAIYVYPASG